MAAMRGGLIPVKAYRRAARHGRTMWIYRPEHLAASAPRYTSYPTAAEFTPDIGSDAQAAALAAVPWDARLSLYLHIPYCEKICWYCGCNTGAANRGDRLEAYADALHREIAIVAGRLNGRGGVESIHFGGGSPNALSAASLGAVVAALRRRFPVSPGAELSVELDPRTLDDAYIDALAAAGVTRVSLGVQTFAPHVQAKINRLQSVRKVTACVERLRTAGIGGINFDLMYGLPGQMAADIVDTIRHAVALAPDRLAVFGYAHMPKLLARQRMIADRDLPGTAARFAQARVAYHCLVDAGYAPVGFDHFARPGDPLAVAAAEGRLRRNFQGYTDDPADVLIGIGASAISDFPDLLVQNEKEAGGYRARVGKGSLAGARGVQRTADDRLRGAVIEALMCRGEADAAGICRAHGRAEDELDEALARLLPLVADGLVVLDGRRAIIPPAALPYSRVVARAFDAYRATPGTRFSRAI
jgi:oxygen-independent coproporphyrinogen III oxidase